MKCLIVQLVGGLSNFTGNHLEIEWSGGQTLLSRSEYLKLSTIERLNVISEIEVTSDQLLSLNELGGSSPELELAKKANEDLKAKVKTLKAEVKTLKAEVKTLKAEVKKVEKSSVSTSLSGLKKRKK